jgi:hypothetical protein
VCAGGDTQGEIGNRTTPKVLEVFNEGQSDFGEQKFIRQSGIVDPNFRESVFCNEVYFLFVLFF